MSAGVLYGLLGAAVAGSFVVGVIGVLVAQRVARRIDFVDKPGAAHKSHEKVTPYGGGSAIFLAGWLPPVVILLLAQVGALSAWVAGIDPELEAYVGGIASRSGETLVIFAGGIVLHGLGLWDDLKPLGALAKLLAMLGVGAAVSLWGDVRMLEAHLGLVGAVAVTTVWIGVITNAMNFLDNMDGLSGGIAAVCLAVLIACGVMSGQVLVPGLASLFLGALLAFLVFNFPPAKIFMGDAGSLLVGYNLAVISILTSYYDSGSGAPPYAIAMPLIILAIPLYDFCSVMLIRLREGRNPWQGDQRHFSHRLVDRGLTRTQAVLTIYLSTATTGLGAVLLPGAGLATALVVLAIVVLVLAMIAILESPTAKEA